MNNWTIYSKHGFIWCFGNELVVDGFRQMDLDALSRANMLVEKIRCVEDQIVKLREQYKRCETYLEPCGKKDYFYFEDVICYMVLPNQGNGDQKFFLHGNDPDAKCFYKNMITEMKDIFENKINKATEELKHLESELDSL